MLGIARPVPLSISPLLPAALRSRADLLDRALYRLLAPADLNRRFRRAQAASSGSQFAREFLKDLQIEVDVSPSDVARIPRAGSAIVVANHPYGFAEGLILSALFDSVRPDYRLVGNSVLQGVEPLLDHLILVNPFETPGAARQNCTPLREALIWLQCGGILIMFPAGEVSRKNWRDGSVSDPAWKTTAARLALRAGCPVIPIFFSGSNSVPFHLAAALHPALRTALIPREFHKLRRKTITLRVGRAITGGELNRHIDPLRATEFLCARTHFLANALGKPQCGPVVGKAPRPLARRSCGGSITKEIMSLPPERELAASDDFSVLLTTAQETPKVIAEVGRLREITFREAGEGTGNETDTDRFDAHYRHLLLWNKSAGTVAGAYRLALTSEVLRSFGPEGLYTNTLFRYDPRFFERIGPAVELGRSFICRDYQKSYSPLLLLWKGITRFVGRNPEAALLFGAVSISRAYREASRQLIAAYLLRSALHPAAGLVQPRKGRAIEPSDPWIARLANLAGGIQDVSAAVSDIESDAKEVPPLVRHYLGAGGRLLACAVDPSFSNCLDALMLADLRSAAPSMLQRYMGKPGAMAFLDWHARRRSLSMV